MNGEVCCILSVCCPPEAAEAALAKSLMEHVGCTEADAKKHAAFTMAHFDLAPKGTLGGLKTAIADMARKHHHETT